MIFSDIPEDKLKELDNFSTVTEFAQWYINNKMPKRFSLYETSIDYPEVFLSDDATSTLLFRYKQFQVEMYLIHPKPKVPLHEHPGVEAIEITPRFWDYTSSRNLDNKVLREGHAHGDTIKSAARARGFYLLSCQKWANHLQPSTISSRWKGELAGPLHAAIVRRFNPTCFISEDLFADVTKETPILGT